MKSDTCAGGEGKSRDQGPGGGAGGSMCGTNERTRSPLIWRFPHATWGRRIRSYRKKSLPGRGPGRLGMIVRRLSSVTAAGGADHLGARHLLAALGGCHLADQLGVLELALEAHLERLVAELHHHREIDRVVLEIDLLDREGPVQAAQVGVDHEPLRARAALGDDFQVPGADQGRALTRSLDRRFAAFRLQGAGQGVPLDRPLEGGFIRAIRIGALGLEGQLALGELHVRDRKLAPLGLPLARELSLFVCAEGEGRRGFPVVPLGLEVPDARRPGQTRGPHAGQRGLASLARDGAGELALGDGPLEGRGAGLAVPVLTDPGEAELALFKLDILQRVDAPEADPLARHVPVLVAGERQNRFHLSAIELGLDVPVPGQSAPAGLLGR